MFPEDSLKKYVLTIMYLKCNPKDIPKPPFMARLSIGTRVQEPAWGPIPVFLLQRYGGVDLSPGREGGL